MSDQSVEDLIASSGLSDRRVKPEDLEAEIVEEHYHVFGRTQLTVCCLVLKNGFTVTGESACADPANFRIEIGRRIARENAKAKIWPLLGFRLKDQLAKEGS